MATGLNRADILQTKGMYNPPKGASPILGLEAAGFLVDPHNDTVSDQPVACLLSGGGYADYARVHKGHLMKIPKGFSFTDAAAIPEQWITAYQLLHFIARIKEDETCLIHGAAGGVGTCLIQLTELAKAHSIAVASTSDKVKFCIDLGSYDGISYKQLPDFSQRINQMTNG